MKLSELAKLMRDTEYSMKWAAHMMKKHGGSSEAVQHAEELAGAADIVGEWADELEKKEKQ